MEDIGAFSLVVQQATYLETRLMRLELKARAGKADAEELAHMADLREQTDELAYILTSDDPEMSA